MLERAIQRYLPLAILAAAIAIGAYLRCANLAALELSADEGASWAAASAPTLAQVWQLQTRLNPGELGLHDVALHLWMGLFGDGLAAMRSLSAFAGTIAIILLLLVAREILRPEPPPLDDSTTPNESEPETAEADLIADDDLVAALGAVIFAVNLVTIKYSREARMYPMALALVLAQVWFFSRAVRAGKLIDYAGTALFTALALAATFASSLILVPEGLYLLLALADSPPRSWRLVAAIGSSLAVGILLVAPLLLVSIQIRGGAPNQQTWAWIPRPSLGAPIALFNKATGTYAFPLLAILAASGVVRQWHVRRPALTFLILWMFAPPIALTIVSYAIQPAFVERYLLSSFAPFFLLAAIGLLELKPAALRPGALALVVALALAHVVVWNRRPHGAQFAEAAAAASTGLGPGDAVGVAPRYAANVVRYYLRDTQPHRTVEAVDAQPAPTVMIVADTSDPNATAELARRYPRLLAHFDGVVVRGP